MKNKFNPDLTTILQGIVNDGVDVVRVRERVGRERWGNKTSASGRVSDMFDITGLPSVYQKPVYKELLRRWAQMHNRLNMDYKIQNPTYRNCQISDEWFLLSNFARWTLIQQEWWCRILNKDWRVIDSNIYSAETCLYVTRTASNVLKTCRGGRSKLGMWVYYDAPGSYRAAVQVHGKRVDGKSFDTLKSARDWAIKIKNESVMAVVNKPENRHLLPYHKQHLWNVERHEAERVLANAEITARKEFLEKAKAEKLNR